MKKLLVLLMAAVLLLPSFAFADGGKGEVTNVVCVGYDVSHRYELFGNMDQSEIDRFLGEECSKLKARNLSDFTLEKDGLIKTVAPTMKFSEGFLPYEEVGGFEGYTPYAQDEKPISKTFRYIVAFDVQGIGEVRGGYQTSVYGSYSSISRRGVISSLHTSNVEGGYFPTRDHANGTSLAYTTFSNPWTPGTVVPGTATFEATSSGTIVFHGVR